MLDKLNNEFNLNKILLNLHSLRGELLASNIANSDTPKYVSFDVDFSKIFKTLIKNTLETKNTDLAVTSKKHIHTQKRPEPTNIKYPNNSYISRNKAVNIDLERINFVHNGLQYHADIVFINNKFRNIMNVLQG